MGQDTAEESKPQLYTIGHSTRKLEELIAALRHYQAKRLVDIRHFPSSRHNPQFNREVLQAVLPEAGIEYLWLQRLGGYRDGGYLAYMGGRNFWRASTSWRSWRGRSAPLACAPR